MTGSNPYQPAPLVKLKHPEWSKHAAIYQINTRQILESVRGGRLGRLEGLVIGQDGLGIADGGDQVA